MHVTATDEPARKRQLLRQRIVKGAKYFGGAWAIWIIVVLVFTSCGAIQGIGAFGDSMAFIGSIATALALLVAAYSMLLQREDIDAQIAEMEGSRKAAERLAAAQSRDTTVRRIEVVLRLCRETSSWVEGSVEAIRAQFNAASELVRQYAFAGRAHSPQSREAEAERDAKHGLLNTLLEKLPKTRELLQTQESRLVSGLCADQPEIDLDDVATEISLAASGWREMFEGARPKS